VTTQQLAVPLREQTLARLPAGVATPRYDRADLRTGVVHFGVGGFHRAHEAAYLRCGSTCSPRTTRRRCWPS